MQKRLRAKGRTPGLRSTDYQISLTEAASASQTALVIRIPIHDPVTFQVVSCFDKPTYAKFHCVENRAI